MRFHICTIVNRPEMYRQMRESFDSAGFRSPACRYTVLDNTVANLFEPYNEINKAMETTSEDYLIFCHQDVLLDQGDGYDALVDRLRELDVIDRNWAIAGNAGGTETLRLAMYITDASSTWKVGDLPRRVISLDENFLILNPQLPVRCSKSLSGFHLYGTDLPLNAYHNGFSSYVIRFHLRHLSTGYCPPEVFEMARNQFEKRWCTQRRFQYIKTCCTMIFLSRYSAVRQFFGSKAARGLAERYPRIFSAVNVGMCILSGRSV